MFLLVHLDRHRDRMGEILNRLVSDFGVPVSICDDIQKFCPKCADSPGAESDSSTISTTISIKSAEHNHDDHSKLSDNHQKSLPKVFPQNVPKVFPQSIPKTLPAVQKASVSSVPIKPVLATPPPTARPTQALTKVLPLPPKNMAIPLRVAPATQTAKVVIAPPKATTNGNHHPPQQSSTQHHQQTTQMMVVKRKESPINATPEVKKAKIDPPLKMIHDEILLDDDDDLGDQSDIMGTVLKVLQNGGDMQFNGSGGSSDDGASNSSNIYDVDDDDDMKEAWNPDFLTNFITSQPDIFSATTQESTRLQQSKTTQMSTGKRVVPPMLTVNGKTRRGRIVYTSHELNILEKYYEEDPNACADPKKREVMCKTLSIDYHRLKVWFQNRRRKDKVKSQDGSVISFNGLDVLDNLDYSPESTSLMT
ncbi:unnamed protein product [Caenorhabditis brenneri]